MKLITFLFSFLFLTVAASATEVRILRQAGSGASQPLQVTWLELLPKHAEKMGIKDLKITTVDFQNGLDANIAMMAGQLDVLVTGTGSFAVLQAKDPSVKALSMFGSYDWWLTCNNPEIKSLKDIKPNHKIAMKGLNSGEHIFVRQLAAKELGDWKKLDGNLVVLPRPQIVQAMKANKDIDCSVLGAPLQASVVRDGTAKLIAKSDNSKVQGSIILIYSTKKWLDTNPKLARAMINAELEAIELYQKDPSTAMRKFKELDKVNDSVDDLVKTANEVGQTWSINPNKYSLKQHLDDLIDMGIVNGKKLDYKEIFWNYDLVK